MPALSRTARAVEGSAERQSGRGRGRYSAWEVVLPPVRVLITSPVFQPDLGGPAVYVSSLARFLFKRGHETKVVAFCSDPSPAGHPFPVVAVSRGSLPVRYLKALFAVLRKARVVDLVYVNEHLALLHVLAVRLRRGRFAGASRGSREGVLGTVRT